MKDQFSRRDVVKAALIAGATAIINPARSETPDFPLSIASTPIELSLTAVSAHTIRLTIQAVHNGAVEPVQSDGSLVESEWGPALAQIRSLSGVRVLRSGNLVISVSPGPLSIRIETEAGRVVQELTLDQDSDLLFNIAGGNLFGLGQGGPQFDRRGHIDSMSNGQGGYQLGTHGARVPIQFLIGSAGWGIFVHAPLVSFDLSGSRGRVHALEERASLPVDVFIIAADEPSQILAEYAKITGFPEMPPLWSFGYQQSHRTLDRPAEILAEAQLFREKKLPCDAMIYLGTGERHEGGRELVREVDLGRLPLYVRAGAVLPTGPPKQYTDEPAVEPLTITVFPGANGAGSLYEDDGESFDFRNGAFMRIEMQWEDKTRNLAIHLAPGARILGANPKTFSIKVIDSSQTKTVVFNGDPLSVAF